MTPTHPSAPGRPPRREAAEWVHRLLEVRSRDASLAELLELIADAPVSELLNTVRSAQR